MLQKRHKNSLQSTESQQDQKYREYSEVVADVLKAFYSHSLRNIPQNFQSIVIDWSNLFIKCGIPASQLMDLYLEAHASLEKGEYFNIDTILAVWNDRRELRLQEERRKEPCSVCKGTRTTTKFDFTLREDVQVDCPKCV